MPHDDTIDFANYFINNYGACVESWVYCHRLHAGINTNMHIEKNAPDFLRLKN